MSQHTENPDAIERQDASPKGLLIFLGGFVVMLALVLGLVAWLFGLFAAPAELVRPLPPMPVEVMLPPEPRLERVPGTTARHQHARDRETLSTYGWVDRQQGVVRVPIDRAMDIVAERGLPARQEQLKSDERK